MKPISSAISGIANRAQQAGNLTGSPHGETGFAVALSADPNREMHKAVTFRSPSANLEAALSRMQQFGVTCSVKMETVFPTTMDGETTFRQKPVSLTVNTASSADLLAALRIANEALAPASAEQIEEWLAELSVKTARRRENEASADFALSVYTNHLRQYPADAVRHVLTSYRGTWFPTWGELADRLDEFAGPRRMIRDQLMAIIEGRAHPQIEYEPRSARIHQLREELAHLDKSILRYPELACEEIATKRARILADIEGLK